ncbi:MAG TPA: carbohydrate-binding family 9-like protein [Tepidisphaeraceae bacterium]|nr:carbohydrate-binding family 9-like protein [Tepidisphaeraceae bacterium]
MKTMSHLLIVVVSIATFAKDAPTTREYICHHTTDEQIQIDGTITESEWANAPWSREFVDIVGNPSSPKPPFATRIKMLWSDTTLYIAAHLEETKIAAKLTTHDDDLYTENAFEVFIDPDGDGKNYCELEYNALNASMDLLMDKPYRERGKADKSYELQGMKTAIHVDGTLNDSKDTDRGWDIEIAIPFGALKSISNVDHPRAGDQWRFNFARAEYLQPEKATWSVWSPHGRVDMHVPSRFGIVRFATKAP